MAPTSRMARNAAQVRRRTARSASAITSRSTPPKSIFSHRAAANCVYCIQSPLLYVLAFLWIALLFIFSSPISIFWVLLLAICVFSPLGCCGRSRSRLHFGNLGGLLGKHYRSMPVENRGICCHKPHISCGLQLWLNIAEQGYSDGIPERHRGSPDVIHRRKRDSYRMLRRGDHDGDHGGLYPMGVHGGSISAHDWPRTAEGRQKHSMTDGVSTLSLSSDETRPEQLPRHPPRDAYKTALAPAMEEKRRNTDIDTEINPRIHPRIDPHSRQPYQQSTDTFNQLSTAKDNIDALNQPSTGKDNIDNSRLTTYSSRFISNSSNLFASYVDY